MNSTVKTVVFWLVIVLSAFLLWQVVKSSNSGQKDTESNFSQFMSDVDKGSVKEVTITGMEVRGKYTNDKQFHTTIPANYPAMIDTLRNKGVVINFRDSNGGGWPSWLFARGDVASDRRATGLGKEEHLRRIPVPSILDDDRAEAA